VKEDKIFLLEIILPLPVDTIFTFYCLENDFKNIKIGCRVIVPFGKINIKKIGIVLKINSLIQKKFDYKKIIEVIDKNPIITNKQLKILKWVSNYYMTSFTKTVNQLIPNFLLNKKILDNYKPKIKNFIKLNRSKKKDLKNIKFKKQIEIINEINKINNKTKNYDINIKELINNNLSKTSINTLIKKEYLVKYQKNVSRLLNKKIVKESNILNKEEKLLFQKLYEKYQKNNKILFTGVSFLERQKIYIELIQKEISRKNRVLYILPDIFFKKKLIQKFENIFGNKLTILKPYHSNNYKIENYISILNNNFSIIIGGKNSIFYPIKNLSLIIIDNEENFLLKESRKDLKYNAKDISLVFSKIYNNKIVLGSSNPSLETYYNSKQKIFSLVSKINSNQIKNNNQLTIINTLEKKIKNKMNGSFSNLLIRNINRSLKKNKQVVIYNHNKNELEKHKDELKEIIKNVKIDIITNDINQNILNKKINDINENKINIILINQLIKSILPIENIETIGILNAEKMISFPNFRSMEKTFQTINLIINEGSNELKLYIQTLDPNSKIFIFLKKNQSRLFYENELFERKKFNYPPYTRLIKIKFKSFNKNQAKNDANKFYNKINELIDKRNILGPNTKKHENVYLVLKIGKNKYDINRIKKNIIKVFNKLKIKSIISLDVDPIN
tara:strand:+ start:132 stop:2153 length:2022 start_codon:yes stop_codon:yes gene_type:complete